jgi:hypothetical protein
VSKTFGREITLARNSRGCYILDTVKGCSIVNSRPGGCYGECYAANIAKRYRWDFGCPVSRAFADEKSKSVLIRQIQKASMPFIRIGEMGDPSEDWENTLSIVAQVSGYGKQVVIITKHWKPIPGALLPLLAGVTVNTSVSALDSRCEVAYRLQQLDRLKPWCNSVLRVVSCRFNDASYEGRQRKEIQDGLFRRDPIDTVFRPSAKNEFIERGVIHAESRRFLGSTMLASVRDEATHFGDCESCPDQCGINRAHRLSLL